MHKDKEALPIKGPKLSDTLHSNMLLHSFTRDFAHHTDGILTELRLILRMLEGSLLHSFTRAEPHHRNLPAVEAGPPSARRSAVALVQRGATFRRLSRYPPHAKHRNVHTQLLLERQLHEAHLDLRHWQGKVMGS